MVWEDQILVFCVAAFMSPEGAALGRLFSSMSEGWEGWWQGKCSHCHSNLLACVLFPVLFGCRQGVGLQPWWVFSHNYFLSATTLTRDFCFFWSWCLRLSSAGKHSVWWSHQGCHLVILLPCPREVTGGHADHPGNRLSICGLVQLWFCFQLSWKLWWRMNLTG